MSKLIDKVPDFMSCIADFYEMICHPCSQSRINYYNNVINKYTSSLHKNILDLGCCTGKTAERLLKENYSIDGIDLSTGMINIANEKTKNNSLNFYVADMRTIHTSKKYDVIYCNSLEWLKSYDDLEKTLRSATKMLKDDGIIILDFPNSSNFLNNYSKLSASNVKTQNHVYYKLTTFNDIKGNIIDSSQTYITINKLTGDIDTYSCDMIWRIHHLHEVEYILKKFNIDVLEIVGSYNEKNVEDSLFVQIVGKKDRMDDNKIIVKELKPELTQCRIIQMEKNSSKNESTDMEKCEENAESEV